MMHIMKDEIYNWFPVSPNTLSGAYAADARIPDELGTKLHQAIDNYKSICNEIDKHLENHDEDVVRYYPWP